MRNTIRKKKRTCHFILFRSSNKVVARMTKQAIADSLSLSVKTINRYIDSNGEYHCEEYSIWCDISIPLIKRGFHKL